MMKKFVSAGAVALLFLGEVSAIDTNGWVRKDKADGSSMIEITLPVKQSNLELVESIFWDVSNPKHASYGKYLSFEEINEITRNDASTQAVMNYLSSLGVTQIKSDPYGNFLTFKMPVAKANEAFNADFHTYAHPRVEGQIVKTEQVSLPAELEEHVIHVPHVTYFPHPDRKVRFTPDIEAFAAMSTLTADAVQPKGYVTPALLQQFYGINNPIVSHGANQSLFGALGQQYSNTDLAKFQQQFGLTNSPVRFQVGANNPNACLGAQGGENCGEANLDVQWIMAVAQQAVTVFWNIDGNAPDPFVTWSQQLSQYSNLPQVHSISYGGPEAGVPQQNRQIFNTAVQKLATQGGSVLIASGDDGAAGTGARDNPNNCRYTPDWPSTSPYVTAVGATQGPESGKAEVVCSSLTGGVITSGGGFSNLYARPAYQNAQVAAYLQRNQPVAGFQPQGRAYPDVSVMGFNYPVVVGGQFALESGTSASAPVFAGMVTLINDARMAAGKPALGFLNQALYSVNANVWNDIVTGDIRCTANNRVCCPQGFAAVAGWDPASGLGSPRFQALLQALVAM
jgi:tripeptidyl-peptidase-1